jgi:hypothetical protein
MAYESLGGTPDAIQVVNPVLTNLAIKYEPHGWGYDKIVNNFPVTKAIGQYPVFDLSGFYASGDGRPVADDAQTPIIDFKYEMALFHAHPYRKRVRVTREDLQQAHPALRLVESKIMGLMDVFAGEREKRLAEKLRDTSITGGQLTGGTKVPTVLWDAGTKTTEATIQADIKAASQAVYAGTGRRPNTMIMTANVAEAIAVDYTLKTQLQYQMGMQQITEGPGILPEKLFGLNTIVLDGVQTNTAQAGATATLSEIWGKNVIVCYIDPNPRWGVPSLVYGFRAPVTDGGWTQATEATATGGPVQVEPGSAGGYIVVDQWAEPDPPANNYRVWERVDERVVAPGLGYELKAVIS